MQAAATWSPLPHRLVALKANAATRFLTALAPTGAALVFQFATFWVTARGLGVAQFGQYAAIIALAAILVEIAGGGSGDLLVRAVSRDPLRMPAYFGNLVVLVALTTAPIVMIGVLVALAVTGSGLSPVTIAVGLLGEVIAARVSASSEMMMIAHGHIVRASCVRVLTGMTRLTAAALFFAHGRTLDGWVWVVLAQSAVLAAALIWYLVRLYGAPRLCWLRGETGAGLAFALNQTARATQSNVDRIVLSHFASDVAVGIYAAGSRLLVIGLFPIQVMTRMLYPNFFRHGVNGIAATRRYALRCIPAMLGASLLSLLAIMIAAQALPVLLGRDFAGSRHAASLLALAMPLIGLQYLGADTLTGAGYQHIRAVISVIASGMFGLAMALGAHIAGVNGVIAAFLGSHFAFMVAMWTAALIVRDSGASLAA